MTGKISPSLMCADISSLASTLKTFEKEGIEYLHIDIMDGIFVPNFTLGTDYCKALEKMTDIPLDIHLMITEPEKKLGWFPIRKGDIVSVHAESTCHLQKAVGEIKNAGGIPMVALNPATPVNALDYVLDDIGGVLVMTVNPGFAGQKMIPATLQKITDTRKYLDKKGYENVFIEVDGNVSFENAKLMRKAGADIFVAGTSSVFKSGLTLTDGIKELRKAIE